MRARAECCTPEQAEEDEAGEETPGLRGDAAAHRETEARRLAHRGSEQLQVEEEARVNPGDLAGAPAVPAQEYGAQALAQEVVTGGTTADGAKASPADGQGFLGGRNCQRPLGPHRLPR
ncbi:hypothetical protein Cadr_000002526 [Camelus dromedarius]|uniref:Uncharacterized protein n=1 Tax=Camelus dromedarius TaxID=9838 RepID=A0A5N4C1L6_CAMDR|nr:hypothetical protein Cadr_000002526 [Camelus dromedarius]